MFTTAARRRTLSCETFRSSATSAISPKHSANTCGNTNTFRTGRSVRSIGWSDPGFTARPRAFPICGVSAARTCRRSSSATPHSPSSTKKAVPGPASKSASPKDRAPAARPITAMSFFNISGMSYGALSHAADLGAVARRESREYLDGDRRRRPRAVSSGRRLRRRHADGHGEIRRARRRGQSVGGPVARDRRVRPGPHVRGQARARGETGQRRHSAGHQGDPSRSPKFAAFRSARTASAPTATRTSATFANSVRS